MGAGVLGAGVIGAGVIGAGVTGAGVAGGVGDVSGSKKIPSKKFQHLRLMGISKQISLGLLPGTTPPGNGAPLSPAPPNRSRKNLPATAGRFGTIDPDEGPPGAGVPDPGLLGFPESFCTTSLNRFSLTSALMGVPTTGLPPAFGDPPVLGSTGPGAPGLAPAKPFKRPSNIPTNNSSRLSTKSTTPPNKLSNNSVTKPLPSAPPNRPPKRPPNKSPKVSPNRPPTKPSLPKRPSKRPGTKPSLPLPPNKPPKRFPTKPSFCSALPPAAGAAVLSTLLKRLTIASTSMGALIRLETVLSSPLIMICLALEYHTFKIYFHYFEPIAKTNAVSVQLRPTLSTRKNLSAALYSPISLIEDLIMMTSVSHFSPFTTVFTITTAHCRIDGIGRMIGARHIRRIGGNVGGRVGGKVGGSVGGNVGGRVGGKVAGCVGGKVGGKVGGCVGGKVGGSVGGCVGGIVGG
ncbi:hypothetical protein FF38_02849 [Lucilia cuprina]|uniref:Uncharacterized protein n=1 Tax=Lucilia cuprina TaxID=7375 RepID=A0A0L0CIQ1_LUCCU|nr:hypothetical protein FF38_02849 [Lucilia cuprina]